MGLIVGMVVVGLSHITVVAHSVFSHQVAAILSIVVARPPGRPHALQWYARFASSQVMRRQPIIVSHTLQTFPQLRLGTLETLGWWTLGPLTILHLI